MHLARGECFRENSFKPSSFAANSWARHVRFFDCGSKITIVPQHYALNDMFFMLIISWL